MSLLLAAILLGTPAPAAACTAAPAFDTADVQSSQPVEASGPGLWIAGVRFRGTDIVAAAAGPDGPTAWAVDLRLSTSGKARFDAIQRCRINQLIEVSFDGVAVARTLLVEEIDGPFIRIAGNFTQPAAARLTRRISDFR